MVKFYGGEKMFDFFKKPASATAIIVAAGNGTRMKSEKSKQLIEINDIPVIAHTMLAFENTDIVDEIIVVTRESDILIISDITKEFGISKVTNIVPGGATRTDSVKNGIHHAKNTYVAIHDGARPCINPEDIEKTIKKAIETGAAALGYPVTDTLKKVDENQIITNTISRENLWAIQTPQVFEKSLILKAYEEGNTQNATDDCMLLESIGIKASMVCGSRNNIKITVPEDVDLASAILSKEI